MEDRELVCVCCPRGCRIHVQMEDGKVLSVAGNSCPKGDAYARQECIRPMRILTTTVRAEGGIHRVCPVISASEIPLDLMKEAMDEVRTAKVTAPVKEGQVILKDLAGTGVALVASRSLERS